MAEFNPAVPEGDMPNNLNVSRGAGPNRSFETLFSGIGDAISGLAKTGDNFIQGEITNDARYARDSMDDEMGLSSTAVPQEITQSQAGLSKLAQAQIQGKVTPEYYYQRLSATMKGLRAKYPGYEQQVDEALTKATGVQPANAFRNALFENINQQNTLMAGQANKTQALVNENIKYLNPNEQDPSNVPGGVSGQWGIIAQRKSVEYQNEAERKVAEQDGSRAGTIFNTQVSRDVAGTIDQATGPAFGNQSFITALSGLQSGQGLSPDQQTAMTAQLDSVIAAKKLQYAKWKTLPAFGNLDPKKAEDGITAGLQPLLDIRQMIADKNYDGAAQAAAQVKMMQDTATARLFNNNPFLLNASSLAKIAPQVTDNATNEWLSRPAQGGSPINFLEKNYVGAAVKGAVSGSGQFSAQKYVDTLTNTPEWDPKKKSTMLASFMDGFSTVAPSLAKDPTKVPGFVNDNYSMALKDDKLWQSVQDADKLQLFNTMYSPRITQAIAASGNQDAIQTYRESALNRIQGIGDLRTAAASVAQLDPSDVRAVYNDKTNRIEFRVTTTNSGRTDDYGRQIDVDPRVQTKALNDITGNLNSVLGVMQPIDKAAGQTNGVQQVLQKLSSQFDVNGNGFFKQIAGQLQSAQGASKPGEDNTVPPQPGEQIINGSGAAQGDGNLDFNFSDYRVPDAPRTRMPQGVDDSGGKLPAGMRNNNPGNIKYTPTSARWAGVVGPSTNTDQGDHQLVFQTPEDGMRATYNLLMRKYNAGKITPDQIIAGNGGWTPGNHGAAANVARSMGINPSEDINLSDPTRAAAFMRGLFLQEHGTASRRYSDEMIMNAITNGQTTQ